MSTINYYLHLLIALLLQIFVFKTKIFYEDDSRQNKEIKGSAIIISNHRSFLDGLVIALKYFFKRFHFIVADFYKHRYKIVKVIIKAAGGIFVDSEVNSFDFMEKSKRIIKKGRSIMIFPEGDFKHTYEPSKFSIGYIMLAIKTGLKIIPIVSDFNYGLFKRVHLMIGKNIDLRNYTNAELTKAKLKEINEEIYNKFLMLFYGLKKEKAEKILYKYEFSSPKRGDVVRVNAGSYFHYGIFLNANEVIQFGNTVNRADENVVVNSVSLKDFCGTKIPEVRKIKNKFTRRTDDIERYAKSCLGQGRYNMINNNCLDFANRVTLKI